LTAGPQGEAYIVIVRGQLPIIPRVTVCTEPEEIYGQRLVVSAFKTKLRTQFQREPVFGPVEAAERFSDLQNRRGQRFL